MPLPLPPVPAPAWHHVLRHGAGRRRLFFDACDRRHFLRALAAAVARGGCRVHAYCLMDTHYHLLLEDVGGGLGAALRRLHRAHAAAFRRRHGGAGPLLRPGPASRAVQDEAHALQLLRHVHLAPVRAGWARCPAAYPWSSHPAYVGGAPPPPWLCTALMAARCASAPPPLAAAAALGAVAAVCGCAPAALVARRRGHDNAPRDLAIALMARFGGLPPGPLARLFGLRPRGLAAALARVPTILHGEPGRTVLRCLGLAGDGAPAARLSAGR